MDLQFGMCPQCKQDIAEERLRESVVICQHCGFSDQKTNKSLEKKIFKSYLKASLLVTVLLVASFIQAVNWDQYFFSIIPLKIKEMTSTASTMDLKEITRICNERKKWDCVEASLLKTYQSSPNTEIEALAELGKIQFQRGETDAALQTFSTYFAQGGLSLDASYDYARSLSLRGQVDQASQVYEKILEAKPDTLQVTVAQNYVRLLMNNNRFSQAKDLLEEIRKSGSNANMFMDKEFQEIATHAHE
jgi:tetratricopeptide (TPR) repeat protein